MKKEEQLESETKNCGQEERIHQWKEHFKNLLGNFLKGTDKAIARIINSQQDIRFGQFIEE